MFQIGLQGSLRSSQARAGTEPISEHSLSSSHPHGLNNHSLQHQAQPFQREPPSGGHLSEALQRSVLPQKDSIYSIFDKERSGNFIFESKPATEPYSNGASEEPSQEPSLMQPSQVSQQHYSPVKALHDESTVNNSRLNVSEYMNEIQKLKQRKEALLKQSYALTASHATEGPSTNEPAYEPVSNSSKVEGRHTFVFGSPFMTNQSQDLVASVTASGSHQRSEQFKIEDLTPKSLKEDYIKEAS